MIYRTPPEKPMKIQISLRPSEIAEAVRLYAEEQKGMKIPDSFEACAVRDPSGTVYDPDVNSGTVVEVEWREKR